MADAPTILGPDPETKSPKLKTPSGAADCHFHIFGPQEKYPYVEERRYTPQEVLESDYRKMADVLGLERGVVVQASPYGQDNARVLEAVRILGPGYRGIGVVSPDIPEDELEDLTKRGICGTRINFASGARSGIEWMSELAVKIKPFGWHIQFHLEAEQLPGYASELRALPVDFVLDHMGLFPPRLGLDHPAFGALADLLETGRGWVKLSGAERITSEAYPYRDAHAVARALIEAAPERVVWGTDWPHTRVRPTIPNDGDLLDLLLEYAPDENVRRRILVENPAALYGFG